MSSVQSRCAAMGIMTMAGLIFLLASVFMVNRVEPFLTWYYVFAWWAYILFAEGLLHMKGLKSSLFDSTKRFMLQLPLSVTIWLIFELYNFRLQNWQYISVPSSLPLRWVGYAVSYATVLPGLNVTAQLVRHLAPFSSVRWTPLDFGRATRRSITALGLGCLILPLVWPGVFFPLIWLGFIGVLLPLDRCPESRSLSESIRNGRPCKWLEILLAGVICGFLWELWNFWAGAKWVYSVPLMGWLKVFEMPLLGFLGFPPFAIECQLMSGCAFELWGSFESSKSRKERWIMRCLLGMALVLFWVLVFSGIDRHTVVSYGA